MEVPNKTLAEALAEKGVTLPGSDITKTSIYIVFSLFLLGVFGNPFAAPPESLAHLCDCSQLVLIASIALAVISGMHVREALTKPLGEFREYVSLYFGKMLIGVSVVAFYGVVCLWILLLGGIMSSPFATLLSISPILLTIQFLRDRTDDYDKVLAVVLANQTAMQIEDPQRSHRRAKAVVLAISVVPVCLVLMTLILGQAAVECLKLHTLILGNGYQQVIGSAWYWHAYYWTYYLSVSIAGFGVLPLDCTRNLTRKFF